MKLAKILNSAGVRRILLAVACALLIATGFNANRLAHDIVLALDRVTIIAPSPF